MIYSDRLPHTLHDFTRRIWTGGAARDVWAPRIQKITTAWAEMERWSVVEGQRLAALTSITPEALPAAAAWAAHYGVLLLPLSRVGRTAEYGASSQSPDAGPWDYRAAYVHPSIAAAWVVAWTGGDDVTLGEYLGYPACCRAFFQRTWVEASCVDTTWAMAHAPCGERRAAPVNWAPEANILWRWLGVRAVPHLPCSFSCAATIASARQYLALGASRGYHDEMSWLMTILSWPIEWSGLHGIAEIKTPIVKVSARTDATAGRYVVQLASECYPLEGARGIVFPYLSAKAHAQLRRTIERAKLLTQSPTQPAMNGFSSYASMVAAHDVIVQATRDAQLQGESVLDLGAGDGTLVHRVGHAVASEPWLMGIELDTTRAKAAVHGVPILAADFMASPNIWPGPYDAILFMPGRLTEVTSSMAERVVRCLHERTSALVVYAYGDWLRGGGLSALVARTLGSDWAWASHVTGAGVEAGVLRRIVP